MTIVSILGTSSTHGRPRTTDSVLPGGSRSGDDPPRQQTAFPVWLRLTVWLSAGHFVQRICGISRQCLFWRYGYQWLFNELFYYDVLLLYVGYNISIIAYGQTGAGKTYTVFGPGLLYAMNEADFGLVPRAVRHIFGKKKVIFKLKLEELMIDDWYFFSTFRNIPRGPFRYRPVTWKSTMERYRISSVPNPSTAK